MTENPTPVETIFVHFTSTMITPEFGDYILCHDSADQEYVPIRIFILLSWKMMQHEIQQTHYPNSYLLYLMYIEKKKISNISKSPTT